MMPYEILRPGIEVSQSEHGLCWQGRPQGYREMKAMQNCKSRFNCMADFVSQGWLLNQRGILVSGDRLGRIFKSVVKNICRIKQNQLCSEIYKSSSC